MLPKFTALFESHRWLCLNRDVRYTERDLFGAQIAIARARLLAATLATREEDEPAALLFALLLEADALRGVRDAFPLLAARNLLMSRGLDLVVDLPGRIELRAIRARALADRNALDELHAGFDAVRTFVAARTRPRE
jgi:hypothetical protein